jgi:hypothetical protein
MKLKLEHLFIKTLYITEMSGNEGREGCGSDGSLF